MITAQSICYKNADVRVLHEMRRCTPSIAFCLQDEQVGVVRIRQQPVCSACNLMRGTLALYTKHLLENNHRENVKKQCDENRFVPSIYDQAIHLAFQNNVSSMIGMKQATCPSIIAGYC